MIVGVFIKIIIILIPADLSKRPKQNDFMVIRRTKNLPAWYIDKQVAKWSII